MAFTLTAQLKLQNPGNISQFINQLRSQIGSVNVNVNVGGGKSLNNLNNSLKQTGTLAKTAGNSVTNFGEQAALAAKRFFAFSVATNGFLKLIGAVQKGVQDAIDFEKELYKISQVTGTAVRDLKDLTSEVTNLSTNLGVSSGKILNAAQTLAQAGLSAEDTKTALAALAKTELSATFDDIKNTTEGAIAIFSQFGVKADQLEGKLGSINAVAGKFAVESSDLVTAVRRTGGAFQAAGGSLEELISLFTSVRATTRESAESIATGFRTIFTRMQRTSTVTFLEDLGIQLRDFEGQFVGPYEAIRRLSGALKDIPSTDPRFAQIIEELGGFRQVSKVIPLIQKFTESEKALVVAQQGQSSLARDAAQAQGSLGNQLAKVGEQFDALIRKIADNTAFKSFVQITTQLATALIKVAEAATPLLPLIGGLVALKGAQLAPSFFKGFVTKGGLGFAKGGLVPGSGNGDTVPARLTPGEFVLRKKAVQDLGVSNLNNLNKGGVVQGYADGGTVDPFSKLSRYNVKPNKSTMVQHKAKFYEEAKAAGIDTSIYSESAISNFLYRNKPLIAQGAAQEQKQNRTNAKEYVESLISKNDRTFGAIYLRPPGIDSDLNTTLNCKIAKGEFAGQNIQLPVLYKQASMTQGSASAFEENFKAQLPNVVSSLASNLAPSFGANVSKTTPASLNRIPGQEAVMGWLFEGALQSLGAPYVEGGDDNRTFDFPKGMGPELTKIFPLNTIPSRPVDAKLTQGTQEQSLRDKAKEWLSAKQNIVKFATGGMARGKDTVPAMLTPGEWVVDKDTAQKIGYGNLERMNKGVQRFAKGGMVQKFASGGRAGAVVNAAQNNPIQTMLLLSIGLQSITQQFSKMSSSVTQVTDALVGFGSHFAVFQGLFQQTAGITRPGVEGLGEKRKKSQGISDRANQFIKLNTDAVGTLQNTLKQIKLDKIPQQGLFNNLNIRKTGGIDVTQDKKTLGQALANRPTPLSPAVAKLRKEENLNIQTALKTKKALEALDKQEQTVLQQQIKQSAKLTRATDRAITIRDNHNKIVAQEAKAIRNERIGTGVLIGSAVASSAGNTLSNIGDANIRAGGQSSALSAAGGTLSGAGTGAAIGMMAGPLGAAIGAVVGGLGGLAFSLYDANRQIAAVKFDKTFKTFSKKLQEGASIGEINAFAREGVARIANTSGDDRVTALGQIESTAVSLDAKFKEVIASFSKGTTENDNIQTKNQEVLKRFYESVDPATINLNLAATGKTLGQFRKELDKNIESANKIAIAQNKAVAAIETVGQRMVTLGNIMGGIQRISVLIDEASANLQNNFNTGQVTQKPSRLQSFISNPNTFSVDEIRPELSNVTKQLGASGNKLAEDFIKGADLAKTVRGTLGGIKARGDISNKKDAITQAFSTQTKGNKILEAAIEAALKGVGDDAKIGEELANNSDGLVKIIEDKILSAGGSEQVKVAQEVYAKTLQLSIDSLNRINELQTQNISLTLQSLDNMSAFNKDLDNLGLSFQKVDVDKVKQSILPGIGVGRINDPAQIGNDVLKTMKDRDKAISDGNYKEATKFSNVITELTQGLEYLSNYSTRAADTLNELAKTRAKRGEAANFVKNTFGGGVSSLRDTARTLKGFDLMRTGQGASVGFQDQLKVIDLLSQNREASVETFGSAEAFDKFVNDTQQSILSSPEAQVLREQGADPKIFVDTLLKNLKNGTVEDQQLAKLKEIYDSSNAAVEQLKLINKTKIDNISDTTEKDIAKAQASGVKQIAQLDVDAAKTILDEVTEKGKTAQNQLDRQQKIIEIGKNNGAANESQVKAFIANPDSFIGNVTKANEEKRINDSLQKFDATTVGKNSEIFKSVQNGEISDIFDSEKNKGTQQREVASAVLKAKGIDAKTIEEFQLGGDFKNIDVSQRDIFGLSYKKGIGAGDKDVTAGVANRITSSVGESFKAFLKERQDKNNDKTVISQSLFSKQQELDKLNRGDATKGEAKLETSTLEEKTRTNNRFNNESTGEVKKAQESLERAESTLRQATAALDAIAQVMKSNPIPSNIEHGGQVQLAMAINGAEALSAIMPNVLELVNQRMNETLQDFNEKNNHRFKLPGVV